MTAPSIAAQIKALQKMTVAELQAKWEEWADQVGVVRR